MQTPQRLFNISKTKTFSADPQYNTATINTNVIVEHTGKVASINHPYFHLLCHCDQNCDYLFFILIIQFHLTLKVTWLSHGMFKSSCNISVEYFPFDIQVIFLITFKLYLQQHLNSKKMPRCLVNLGLDQMIQMTKSYLLQNRTAR